MLLSKSHRQSRFTGARDQRQSTDADSPQVPRPRVGHDPAVAWFDVTTSPEGKDYSVAAYRTGTVRIGAVPGAVPAGAVAGGIDEMLTFGMVTLLINRVLFRRTWTVRVAPWPGPGRKWKERLPTQRAAEQRAEQLIGLIKEGGWSPRHGGPPPTA